MNAESSVENEGRFMREAESLSENDVSTMVGFLKEKFKEWTEEKITIAVTGGSGAGKSSFINAIRELKDDGKTPDAAKTGPVETTKEPKMYSFPSNQKIQFWDLPGIGTPTHSKPEDFYGKVKFKDCDAFIILSDKRFTDNDLQLAKKVKELKKPFFFARTHIDKALEDEREKDGYEEEKTLKLIRDDCMSHLKDIIARKEDLFLIDNKHPDECSQNGCGKVEKCRHFSRLAEAILDVMPPIKKASLALSFNIVTKKIVEEKVEALRGRIWKVALASGVAAAPPVPGVSPAVDVILITRELNRYRSQIGQDEEGIAKLNLAEKIGKFITNCLSPTSKFVAATSSYVEDYSRFIPIIGAFIAGSISSYSTYYILSKCLDQFKETALEIVEEESRDVEASGFDTEDRE